MDLNNELVLVTTTLPSATVTSLLEETGKLVVFRGYGGATNIGELMITMKIKQRVMLRELEYTFA